MNGHAVTSNIILLGWYEDQPVTVNRGGPGGTFHASELFVANNTFDVLANDQVQDFNLHGATSTLNSNVSSLHMESGSVVTTTGTGSVVNSVDIASASVLNLGADLNILFSPLTVVDAGSSINANGFNVSTFSISLGVGGSGSVTVNDVGLLTALNVSFDQGSSMTVHGGVINNLLSLQNGSTLTVLETAGAGLTLAGATTDSLVIDPSAMNLVFNATGWGFRWQDPTDGSGGNWIGTLEAMIAANQIQLAPMAAVPFRCMTWVDTPTLATRPAPNRLRLPWPAWPVCSWVAACSRRAGDREAVPENRPVSPGFYGALIVALAAL